MSTIYNLAIFKPYKAWLNKNSTTFPVPTQKEIPGWYKDADRFFKMPNGEYYKASKEVCPFPKEGTTDDYGKIPTWKACPAIMDAFSTGYVFRTPCDLTFTKNSSGYLDVKVENPMYTEFCVPRPPMPMLCEVVVENSSGLLLNTLCPIATDRMPFTLLRMLSEPIAISQLPPLLEERLP
jgi:hypothetical protein